MKNKNSKRLAPYWLAIGMFVMFQGSIWGALPFGSLDCPKANSSQCPTTNLSGAINVGGWALSQNTVSKVSIYREPVVGEPPGLVFIQDVSFIAGSRPDVAAAYPNYPNNNWGWGTLVLSNEILDSNGDGGRGNGTYRLHTIAYDPFGNSADFGQVTISVNNAASHIPFGTIDTPSEGGGAPGTSYLNWGWALTPQPNIIPTGGTTISVWIDGQFVGYPVYNLSRCDVDQAFPNLRNSGSTNCAQNGSSPGPVGYFSFDTTPYMPTNPYANGLHTISWTVIDNAGNAAGIGSRWFRVAAPVTTAEYDIARTGAYANEVTLTPGNVNASQFGRLWSYPVDGCVYAHPLYMPRVSMNGQMHNVVYIATANNSVYAYDADSSNQTPLWHKGPADFGTPPSPGDGDLHNCANNDFDGPTGIIGTPAIANGTNGSQWMWFVTANVGQYYLRAVNIATGALVVSTQVSATGFGAAHQLQRPGLLVDPSDTYVSLAFGSYNDTSPYQGWVFTYLTNGDPQGALNLAARSNYGASVWMSGGGIASDGNYMYFTTSNGLDDTSPPDYPHSILQLSVAGPPIVGAYIDTTDMNDWNDHDLDLGSSRAIVVPGWNYVISGSKFGDLFIVNRTAPLASSSLQHQLHICNPTRNETSEDFWAFWNGFAFWNNAVFAWCGNDVLRAFNFTNLLSGSTSPVQSAPTQGSTALSVADRGANVTVSSSGVSNGIVWATLPSPANADPTLFPGGQLVAYDANNLAAGPLYKSQLNGLNFQKFTPPIVANGRVYVPTAGSSSGNPQVLVYGLGGQNP
jgi:hypothetical protein